MLKKILKWFRTPLLHDRPQSSPMLMFGFVTLVLIISNFPFSENTIDLKEIIITYSMAVFFIILARLVAWYKEGKNQ